MLTIELANPLDPGPRVLLEQSHALMLELFEPAENHFLGFDALCAPSVHFVAARDGATVLATGAVVAMDGYAEIKSMFTGPDARGRGVAEAILRALEDHARGLDIPLLRLETGKTLAAAIRLYERSGFCRCGAFGGYTANGASVFMEKAL